MPEPQSVVPLLELLRAVAQDHDVHERGRTTVVSCLVDDLQWAIDTVSASTRAAGGIVLNTTRMRSNSDLPSERIDFRAPVTGRSQPVLAASIGSATRYTRGGVEVFVDVTIADGKVDARYVASSAPSFPLPTSSDPLLGLVRAICSHRLGVHRNGLVVVVYDESEFDAQQKEAAWHLRSVLEGLDIGPRTLVFLIASEDPYDATHISRFGGVRFALQGDRLHTRHPASSVDADIANIVSGAPDFIGMFIGAGFSASSGLALGNGLRDRALRRARQSPAGASSEQLAVDWYRYIAREGELLAAEARVPISELASNLTLERVLRHEFREFQGSDPPTLQAFRSDCERALDEMGPAPRALARLIQSGQRLILCTVNFDALIETAASGACRVFVTEEEFDEAPQYLGDYLAGREALVPVLKLHGTIEDLSTCVASDDRTLLGLSAAKQRTMQEVLALATTRQRPPWLYVGASMRDTDLDRFWSQQEFADRFREYWALPYPEQGVRTFMHRHREERWRRENALGVAQHFITETADTFLGLLGDAVG